MKLHAPRRADFLLLGTQFLQKLSGFPVEEQNPRVAAVSDAFVLASRAGASESRAVRVEGHATDAADIDFVLHAVSVQQAGVDFADKFAGLDIPVFNSPLKIG